LLGLREDKTARSVGQLEWWDLAKEVQPMTTTAKRGKTSRQLTSSAKKRSEVHKPREVEYPLTNPDRILYPDSTITKRDLAAYYQRVANRILPYLKDRPLSLLRCPEGRAKSCFFQKHALTGTPEALRRIEISEKGGPENYLIADNLPGLLSLAHPDWLIMDLDPAEVAWEQVVETALLLRDFFARLDLQTFVKTTGGKGLHVVAPLSPRRSNWDEVKNFAQQVAQTFAEQSPDRYLAKMSKAARRGKIFLDYLRNDRGATAIAPYSTRAKPGAPIAVTLAWKELSPETHSDSWRISNIDERLGRKRDPWQGLFDLKQRLPKLREPLRQFIPKE
jgi:bifunctional non-homologous end joining protein LigD